MSYKTTTKAMTTPQRPQGTNNPDDTPQAIKKIKVDRETITSCERQEANQDRKHHACHNNQQLILET
jgi:hypothetical protein